MWFFMKTFLLSVMIAVALQIRIGGQTLEQRTVQLGQSALGLTPIQSVVDASVTLLHRSWDKLNNKLKSNRFHAGARESFFRFSRHPDAVKEKPEAKPSSVPPRLQTL